MIDEATVEARMRQANPIPTVADVDAGEFAHFVAAAHHRRASVTQAPVQHPAPAPIDRFPLRPRRAVLAFAAGFILVLGAVGVTALILQVAREAAITDQPAPPVAAVDESEGLISVESLTWSRVDFGTEGPGLGITAGGPGLVAVGVHGEPDPNDRADGGGGPGWVQGYLALPTVWTSPDGYEWLRVPGSETAFGRDIEIADIAGSDEGFVAVARNYAWTSPDGVTWTLARTSFGPDDELRGVIGGGPGFVAFGEDGVSHRAAVWTSPDGYEWSRVPDDPEVFNGGIYAITGGGPGLVAVGAAERTCQPIVWTSIDGRTWTRVPHDPVAFGETSECGLWFTQSPWLRDVASGGPGLVAVGSDMGSEQVAVWTSPDGVAWNRVQDDPTVFGEPGNQPGTGMGSVAAVGDGLVAIGAKGGAAAVWTSHDGANWIDITEDFDLTSSSVMIEVIAGGPGAVILGEELLEDYTDSRPPLIETVMWVGSPIEPTGS